MNIITITGMPEKPARLQKRAAPPIPARRSSDAVGKSAQEVRLQRFFLASGFSAIYFLVLAVFWWFALVDVRTLVAAGAYISLSCLAFYCVFRLGWNTRFRDASLSLPMSCSAIFCMLGVTYFAPPAQMIFAPCVFCTLAFSALRLTGRKLMWIGLFALFGNALVVALHQVPETNPALLLLEFLHLLVLAATLPVFVALSTRVQRLRHALVSADARIKSIEHSARRDPLTGCFSRKYVFAKLEAQCRRASDNDQSLCLAVFDLDRFKSINDTLGHLGGDEVLRRFVRLCVGEVRDTDVFGRYGGEEFLLVFPRTSLLAAVDTCERIRELVASANWGVSEPISVTVSVGVARYEPSESALEFFSRADAAMYQAKQDGRNQVVLQSQPAAGPAT
jgi:diguanylate cyclase